MSETNKYPLTIAPLFKSGFSLQSIRLSTEVLEKLAKVEAGGKFVIKEVKAESRKSEKSPIAYIEYLTPKEVEERANYYRSGKDADGGI